MQTWHEQMAVQQARERREQERQQALSRKRQTQYELMQRSEMYGAEVEDDAA